MSSDIAPVLTIESLRLHLVAVRDQARAKMAEDAMTPSWEAGDVIAQFLTQRLAPEGVSRAQVWREAMFSPGGDDVRALWIRLTWQTGEILELCLPDHPQMEILLGPPEDAKAPSGLDLGIDLDDPENEMWSPLRPWGAELLPDPFQEDQNWRVATSR